MSVAHNYLVFPVSRDKEIVRFTFRDEGTELFSLDVPLASDEEREYLAYYDIRRFAGKELEIEMPSYAAYEPRFSDRAPSYADIDYPLRPALRLTAPFGWLNDPNGLIEADGVYHIFFQHNPLGTKWGNMHWGHLTTQDFVTYTDRGDALFPDANGTKFSGSAFADEKERLVARKGDKTPLLFYYTAAGAMFSQRVAGSVDGGKTFLNDLLEAPLVPRIYKRSRDPKIEYDAKHDRYMMSLFLEEPNLFAIYCSKNLKDWSLFSELRMEADRECPAFYPMELDGDPEKTLWIFSGAFGRYIVGTLSEECFTPIAPERPLVSLRVPAGCSYAGQSFRAPDGRCLHIDWIRWGEGGAAHKPPCYNSLTFPYELKLVTKDGVPTLVASPAAELERRYVSAASYVLSGAGKLALPEKAYVLEIRMRGERDVSLNVRGVALTYRAEDRALIVGETALPVPSEGEIALFLILDTDGVEIFTDGTVASRAHITPPEERFLSVISSDAISFTVRRLSENHWI